MQKVEILEKIEEGEKDMTPKLIKDLGTRLHTADSTHRYRFGLYECQYCGNKFEANSSNIQRGNTKSCGCQRKGINVTHGMCSNKFFNVWANMFKRCNNPKHKDYKDYGGRGIKVCDEWLDVRNFVAWCELTHPNIEGVTLDRIDNDKGYSPNNCTWSNRMTQNTNQRMKKNNKSGYVGIYYYKKYNTWGANIRINKILKQLGRFSTKEEAVQARDNYIIENNLPHKLSTQY